MKNKIHTISEMEQILLADSTVNDMNPPKNAPNPETILSASQIKRDISVIARGFIDGYCGWPFHKEIVKRQILTGLLKIYNNVSDINSKEFFDLLKPIFAKIPDNHIRAYFGKDITKTSLSHVNKDVGKNLATFDEQIKIEKRDKVLILAIRTLIKLRKENFDKIKELPDSLDKSECFIIDLRGNEGGNSESTDLLADFLYGAKTRSVIKSWIRTTPEARIIQAANSFGRRAKGWAELDNFKDPAVWQNYDEAPYPGFASKSPGYAKPFYILTDGNTGSSAEMFVLRMKHHPYVKYVGDNTAGMEVYGYMGYFVVPNSWIEISVGNVYRQLEQKDFELKGNTPNIVCQNGQDALETALADFDKFKPKSMAKGLER